MEYRGYIINNCEYGGYEFSMQDGDSLRFASSIQDAKREIDEIILSSIEYKVEFRGVTYDFTWLSDAVKFAAQTNGILRDQFRNEFQTI